MSLQNNIQVRHTDSTTRNTNRAYIRIYHKI
nr:MAG TPA: hypothetical protein [Caudoviricetes sp.]